MIKKLSKRIFLIIMTALSIVILGIIILFTFFNYTNTIRTSTSMLDRFINFEPRNATGERDNVDDKMNLDINFDGVYIFKIENSNVIEVSGKTFDEKIGQYAIKVNGGKSQSGIIGDYIYKTRRTKGSNNVILIEIDSMNKLINELLLLAKMENVGELKEYKELDISKETEIIVSMF